AAAVVARSAERCRVVVRPGGGAAGAVIVAEYGEASSIPEMAEAAAAAPDGPLAVAGHSMGGRAAELLRRAPERVVRLALIATVASRCQPVKPARGSAARRACATWRSPARRDARDGPRRAAGRRRAREPAAWAAGRNRRRDVRAPRPADAGRAGAGAAEPARPVELLPPSPARRCPQRQRRPADAAAHAGRDALADPRRLGRRRPLRPHGDAGAAGRRQRRARRLAGGLIAGGFLPTRPGAARQSPAS
ncbi:MAG: alpha/beta hydrolase, partial [Comamonadaceae bacterium]|nr:alpha/beta hydrolase [Comamonadaceae bacterium]